MKILIVDDDATITEAIAASVDWENFHISEVYAAHSIQAARKRLLDTEIDIVISDIEMPGGNGLELLQWFREQKQDGEFLLLTCHENFDYAVNAVKMQVVEYLVKPFHAAALEGALQKCVVNIQKRRQQKENQEWVHNNMSNIREGIFEQLLKEECSERSLDKTIKSIENQMNLQREQEYMLLISRVTETRQAIQQCGESVLKFVLTNIQTESIYGRPQNERAICFVDQGDLIVVVFCEKREKEILFETCERVRKNCDSYIGVTVTLCISSACRVDTFHSTYVHIRDKLFSEVSIYGKVSFDTAIEKHNKTAISFQSTKNLAELLAEKKKSAFLNQLKKELSAVHMSGHLDRQILDSFKQETLQIIYSYLTEKGISASCLFHDAAFSEMERKSLRSVLDMIRWVNHMLEQVFLYEEELRSSNSIISQINQYIHQYYSEHIGRNEIAAVFCLTPEYLAKLYKKRTGLSLKDAINECRIQKAKKLLADGAMISDVAVQVGFDNFSYFSTIFRKYTGDSPSEYKRRVETPF